MLDNLRNLPAGSQFCSIVRCLCRPILSMEQLSHGLTGLIVVATSPLPRFRFFLSFSLYPASGIVSFDSKCGCISGNRLVVPGILPRNVREISIFNVRTTQREGKKNKRTNERKKRNTDIKNTMDFFFRINLSRGVLFND